MRASRLSSAFCPALQGPIAGKCCSVNEKLSCRHLYNARKLGIETVYQDLALAPNRDATANMFLGRELYYGGVVGLLRVLETREMHLRTQDFLTSLQVNVPRVSGIPVVRVSEGQRQSVAIARAAFGRLERVHG